MENPTFNLGGGQETEDMEGMVFDLEGVDEKTSFDLLPKGTYNAVVDKFEFGPNSKGNPMISAVFEVTDAEFEKRKLFDYLVLGGDGSEFGIKKLKKFLVRVCPEIPLNGFNPQKFCDSGAAIGRALQVQVAITTQKQGEYKGEKRNNVRDIFSPSGGGSFLG